MFNTTKFFLALNKKWSFPLRISSVNMTKSAVSCGAGHIYQIIYQTGQILCSVDDINAKAN